MKRILINRVINLIFTMLTIWVASIWVPLSMLTAFFTALSYYVVVGYFDWRKLKDADVKMVFTVTMGVEMPQEMFEQYTTAFPDLTFKSASVRRKYLLFGSYIYKLKFI